MMTGMVLQFVYRNNRFNNKNVSNYALQFHNLFPACLTVCFSFYKKFAVNNNYICDAGKL